MRFSHFAYVNPSVIERGANEVLGPETLTEYKQIKQKLGGRRTSRVFQLFGITAPSRAATTRHKNTEGKKKGKLPQARSGPDNIETSLLEWEKKRKSGGTPGHGRKSCRTGEAWFTSSLLRSKGGSEDMADKSQTPVPAAPLSAMLPPAIRNTIGIKVSKMELESGKDVAGRRGAIVSSTLAHNMQGAATPSPRHSSNLLDSSLLSSSSDASEGKNLVGAEGPTENISIVHQPETEAECGDDGAGQDSSQSDSEAFFVRTKDPNTIATEIGVTKTKLIGGRVRGSLHFESSRRKREFLAEALGSFCLPIMERDLMTSGTKDVLWCVEDLSLKADIIAHYLSR